LGGDLNGDASSNSGALVDGDLSLVGSLELAWDGCSDGHNQVVDRPGVGGDWATAWDVVLLEGGWAGTVDQWDLLQEGAGIWVGAKGKGRRNQESEKEREQRNGNPTDAAGNSTEVIAERKGIPGADVVNAWNLDPDTDLLLKDEGQSEGGDQLRG
jgi:hypothetical protein